MSQHKFGVETWDFSPNEIAERLVFMIAQRGGVAVQWTTQSARGHSGEYDESTRESRVDRKIVLDLYWAKIDLLFSTKNCIETIWLYG
jgi:hypothetical protein